MLKGFRDFILRGNVVELAIGVVIGVAFNDLVKQLTADFITPLIKLIGGGQKLAGVWRVRGQDFLWAEFLNAVINFVLIAAVLYFLVVMPLNRLAARRAKRKAAGEPETDPSPRPDDIVLLTEIRDVLAAIEARSAGVPAQRTGGESVTTV